MGQLLGTMDAVTDQQIVQAVTDLLLDAPRRRLMRKVGLSLVDGEGAGRIAADLAQALREETAPLRARQ